MKFEAASPCFNLFDEARRRTCVAFAEKAQVYGEGIRSLKHSSNVPGTRCARCGPCPRCRSRSAAHHRSYAGEQRLFNLLRTNEVNMPIDAAGSHDVPFPPNHLGARPNNNV